MKKYKIERSNIYVGKLVQPTNMPIKKYFQIYHKLSPEEQKKIKECGRRLCCKEIIRPILFEINENNLAHDLIHTTNINYPILDKKYSILPNSNYIVEEITNIELLLLYLNYKEFLTKHDLKKIYHQLILSIKWLEKNRELFGYREILPGTDLFMGNEQIPHEIYDTLHRLYLIRQKTPSIKELKNQIIIA